MDAHLHERKKLKGPSSDHTSRFASRESWKDLKRPKLEAGTSSKSITVEDGLINVNGYKVKASSGPILEAIFKKYGDIAACCIFRSSSVRASLFEVVCNVVQKLQHHDLEAISSDLENIENEVSDVMASNINLSWLNEHLKNIRKCVPAMKKTIELRKSKAKIVIASEAASIELIERKAELDLAKVRFAEAKKQLNDLSSASEDIDFDILESEWEESFWRRQMDELL